MHQHYIATEKCRARYVQTKKWNAYQWKDLDVNTHSRIILQLQHIWIIVYILKSNTLKSTLLSRISVFSQHLLWKSNNHSTVSSPSMLHTILLTCASPNTLQLSLHLIQFSFDASPGPIIDFIHTHTHTYTHTHAHTPIHIRTAVYTCTYTYIYISGPFFRLSLMRWRVIHI